jgi:predicted AlkP superfamily phosphohydrolase/phosphomutase
MMIAGWLCPSASADGFCHPPDLRDWLEEQFGSYPIHPDIRRHTSAGRYDDAAEMARHGIEVKLEVARRILRRERPRALCVVVTETDSLEHWCWHLLDPSHPAHRPAAAARWRDTLLSVYAALDRALGGLLEEAGPEADVLVVSDHGQAPNAGGQVLLRPWLVERGYLVPRGRSIARRALDSVLRPGFEMLRRTASNRTKAWLRARLPGLQGRAQASTRGLAADWPRTRAWTEAGHIFVNVRGRWPKGCVEPGAEYDALLAELREGLLGLRDAGTGEAPIASVTRGDEQFHGPHADLMPDLLVHWRNDLAVTELIDADAGLIQRPDRPELPLGAHHPDGTLLVSGPRFRPAEAPGAHCIYDVAPTILHLLGQAVPEYFDGSVMTDLMAEQAAKDVRREMMKLSDEGDGRARPLDDDGTVRRRLRSLGYLE